MTGFGKRQDGPGGRRRAMRSEVRLEAALLGIGTSRAVTLTDVSKTGAKMRMPEAMPVGKQVWLKTGPTEIFGIVRWVKGGQCGIVFDEPLQPEVLAQLRERGKVVRVLGFGGDNQIGAEDLEGRIAR